MEVLKSVGEFLLGGFVNLLLLAFAIVVIGGAALFISNWAGEITLSKRSSRFVALCVVASAYYVVEPFIVPVAGVFFDFPDEGLLETGRFAIAIAFVIGFFYFLGSIYKNRDEEASKILVGMPILLLPVLLLVIANVALLAI